MAAAAHRLKTALKLMGANYGVPPAEVPYADCAPGVAGPVPRQDAVSAGSCRKAPDLCFATLPGLRNIRGPAPSPDTPEVSQHDRLVVA